MTDQRTPTHDCDDPAYPAAAMPDECTCGEAARYDAIEGVYPPRPDDEDEGHHARVRIFGQDR